MEAAETSDEVTYASEGKSLEDIFQEVDRLNKRENPESEPFKYKYEARKILLDLHKNYKEQKQKIVEEKESGEPGQDNHLYDDQIAQATESLGRTEYLLGLNYVETEEWGIGEEFLQRAVQSLQSRRIHFSIELGSTWNNLGIVWSNRNKFKKAYIFLREAYNLYKALAKLQTPEQREKQPEEAKELPETPGFWEQVEEQHTHTLYYLAQVYAHLGKAEDSAKFCQLTLQRQLKGHSTFNKKEWITNCIGLSVYYSSNDNLRQVHHCLAAAESLLPEGTFPLQDNAKSASLDENQMMGADVARAWGSFYLHWLKLSQASYRKKKESAAGEEAEEKAGEGASAAVLKFEQLKLEEPPACSLATCFEEARDIFKQGLSWINKALKFYILDGYVTDHIQLLQDSSCLYKYIVAFEPDLSRQCKMHKRRIDRLEKLLEELNPKVYLEFYQQISDEVANCYSDMMEAKILLNRERQDDKLKLAGQAKINQLALKSIHFFEIWLHTFDTPQKTEPEKIEEHNQEVYLSALFSVARLYGKVYHTEARVYVEFLKKSQEHYKKILHLHQKWNMPKDRFGQELQICQEMAQLLPLKIEKIAQTGIAFPN